MGLGLMVIDYDYRLRSINRVMCQVLGVCPDDYGAGQLLSDIVRDPTVLSDITPPFPSQKQVLTLPMTHGTRFVELTATEILLDNEILWLLVAQDVTQQAHIETQWKPFRQAMEYATDGIYVIDRASMKVIDVNNTICEMLGYTRDEILQMGPHEIRTGVSKESLALYFDEIISSTSKCDLVTTALRHKNGSALPVQIHLRASHPAEHHVMVALIRDITENKQTRDALQISEGRFSAIFNQTAVGIAHATIAGRWLCANQKLLQILGYSEVEFQQMTTFDITHPYELKSTQESIERALNGEIQNYASEKRFRCSDGHYISVLVSVSLVRDVHGHPSYFIVIVEDVSARQEMERKLRYLVHYDPLTKLPNRVLLQERLSQAIAHAHHAEQSIGVLVIDLDRLQDINDSLGYDSGDRVIVESAQRIVAVTRNSDTVAHLGGDEFAVVMSDVTHEKNIVDLVQQLLSTLAQPLHILGQELYPTASIGISMYPGDEQGVADLLTSADMAKHQTKENGGNGFQFYKKTMNKRVGNRLKTDTLLRRALKNDELLLHYQPQIDLRSGNIVGVEALIRWQPHDGPLVYPGAFIPITEETGLIALIGEWVLRRACTQGRLWQDAGLTGFRIAVNLSARQFIQHDIVALLSDIVLDTGCNADFLCLEITEGALMQSPKMVIDTLSKLSAMGICLAIDDFGTGYSSLSYLQRFPINTLKIDKSFILDINNREDEAPIPKAVISLAHGLGMRVVAEGVETEEQLAFLRKHQCDIAQGYYFSKPVPLDELERLLRKNGLGLS